MICVTTRVKDDIHRYGGTISGPLNWEVFVCHVQRHLIKWKEKKKVQNRTVAGFWLSYPDLGQGHYVILLYSSFHEQKTLLKILKGFSTLV